MNEFKFLIIKIVTRCRNEMSIAMEWNNIWSLPDHFLELLKKFESWTFRVAIPLTVPMLPIPLSVRGKDPHFVASSVTSWSSIDFKNMCTWFMIACSFIHLDSRQLKFAYDFFFLRRSSSILFAWGVSMSITNGGLRLDNWRFHYLFYRSVSLFNSLLVRS